MPLLFTLTRQDSNVTIEQTVHLQENRDDW